MKKLFFIAFLFTTTASFAQPSPPQGLRKYDIFEVSPETEPVKEEAKTSSFTQYFSVSLSLANSSGMSFGESSYGSIEYGIVKNDIAYGLAIGRGQLTGDVATNDPNPQQLRNYFWEIRIQPQFPLGSVNGYLILGAGSYFDTKAAGFIEYGIGVSKSYGDFSYGVSYSNWNGADYVTPAIGYSF